MSIDIQITGIQTLEKASAKMALVKARMLAEIEVASLQFANNALNNITKNYLSGPRPQKLGVGTGSLRRSIRFRMINTGGGIVIRFGSDLPYAAIHEYGGRTPPHVTRPKRRGFLAWQDEGRWVYTRKPVMHPGSQIPARPYLTPGVQDLIPSFASKIDSIVARALEEAAGGK